LTETITSGSTTITPFTVLGYETTQAGRNIFHDILGRRDDDVSFRPAGLRTGTLNLGFLTEADADECRTFHADGALFVFESDDRPTIGMRYVLGEGGIGVALESETRELWTVAIDYREVS